MCCICTNLLSIYAAVHVAAGSLKPSNPKLSTVLLQLAMFFFLFPLTQGATLLPLGLEVLLRFQGLGTGVPICLLLSLAECALIVAIYHFSLIWQGRLLQISRAEDPGNRDESGALTGEPAVDPPAAWSLPTVPGSIMIPATRPTTRSAPTMEQTARDDRARTKASGVQAAAFILVALSYMTAPSAVAGGDPGASGGEPPYREVPALDAGLPRAEVPPMLETPQSSLESFLDAAADREYDRAARCLNLNAIEVRLQAEAGPRLARQLAEVLAQLSWSGWDGLPDRPDGEQDLQVGMPRSKDEPQPEPQSNILLERVDLGGRDAEIRLEARAGAGGPPVWVVSERTVSHIPALHRVYGETKLERVLPHFLVRARIFEPRRGSGWPGSAR